MAYDHYAFLEKQLHKCDVESEKVIREIENNSDSVPGKKKILKTRRYKNQPQGHIEQYLYNILGVDVFQIYGFKATTALTVFSETSPDLKHKFPTEKQFLS